ncbi:MAG: aldehyde ferredoxin oxidoreductase N-terminal domain-containing protein [Thermodesulfobacteriota bacterium]
MATEFGYTGKMLRVDLSSGRASDIATKGYADRFLGGRGIAAKLYWDEVSPDTKAFDPENRLFLMTGPLTGVPGLASSRLEVCGKSPATTPERFSYASLGGSWGPYLKFAGYDGIVVQGRSDKPVYLLLHDGVCEIRDASELWGKGAIQVRERLKSELGGTTRVLATGPAGDQMVVFASLLADDDASGSGGLGAVMGSKRLKAIAVSGSGKVKVASPEKLREMTQYILELTKGSAKQPRKAPPNPKMKWDMCWGCSSVSCTRATYRADNGEQGKFFCGVASFYKPYANQYYEDSADVIFRAIKLCDDYGLDAKAIAPMITWLKKCEQAGILTDENTGLPLSKMGSLEFIEALMEKISHRDGFGDILAQGVFRAASLIGKGATEQITEATPSTRYLSVGKSTFLPHSWASLPVKAGNSITYEPTLYVTTGLLHMVEPRYPIAELHEISRPVVAWVKALKNKEGAYLSSDVLGVIAEKFWGSKAAADFSTDGGKALAAKIVQDREYVKDSLILCDFFWPIMHTKYSEDHVGDSSIESQLTSAVTGKERDENELYRLGERIFNLQRAILIREGHQGREDDTLPEFFYKVDYVTRRSDNNSEFLVPGKDGQAISRAGAVLDREKFEKLREEYYALRGWDVASGRPKGATLRKLGLEDIAEELEQRDLITEG